MVARPSLSRARPALNLLLALLLALASVAGAQDLPHGFIVERIGSSFDEPLAVAFIDEHRLLVAERAGHVWYVDHDVKRNLVYDIEPQTLTNGDRGLLGLAVAPDFDLTGWIYVLYVVNVHHGNTASYSRLARVRAELDAEGDLIALPATRQNLLGESWPTGIPSCHNTHQLGALRFLSDGSLVLTTGDNADYGILDVGGSDPSCFEPGRTSVDQDLGSYRSQYEDSLDGKVLRVDANTGLGLPDNPFYTGNPADVRSRVYARGLRNPFRFTVLPDSGPREALLVSDVGWNRWEEIELCLGGENFGWPCYEGPAPQEDFQAADTRGICAGIQPTPALLTWNHSRAGTAGFVGQCASGLCVYRGQRYPEVYRGRLFFTDFARSWLRAAELDDQLRIQSTLLFGERLNGPVELVAEPGTGDLVFVSLGSQSGSVWRLRYVGNQNPPVAVASATPNYGAGALDVTLSAAGSSDPDGQPLSAAWDLGDGTSADGLVVLHHYAAGAAYTARVVVTDVEGLSATAEVRITPGNTPPRILAWLAPLEGSTYVSGEDLRVAATAADDEDGTPARASWTLDLAHDHHVHPHWASGEGLVTTVELGEHRDPPPEGQESPGDLHFIVHLAVTDASGLTDEHTVEIYDAQSHPQAHLVELATEEVRVGQTLAPVGHVDFAYGRVLVKQATLTWDWGDGTASVFADARHQVDTRPTHVYRRPGTYNLRLVAQRDGATSVQSASIRVAPARPSVAVFLPLEQGRWVPSEQQDEIVAALTTTLSRRASEVRTFHAGQGAQLAAWMESLAADPLPDVVVLLDVLPSALVEGGLPGSLLERWVASGNGLVWSGATPFQTLLNDDGTEAQTVLTADAFFGASAPFIVLGDGLQQPTPQGRALVPSLAAFPSPRALRIAQLGPEWSVSRLFAVDTDGDSDALELVHHAAHGFYAQFLCSDADDLPRAAVLAEYLNDKLIANRLGAPNAPKQR